MNVEMEYIKLNELSYAVGERKYPPRLDRDPGHHQNLITCSKYHPGPLDKISSQSIHKFLRNVGNKQTDRQAYKHYQKHYLPVRVIIGLSEHIGSSSSI